jgi:hypothetical protein
VVLLLAGLTAFGNLWTGGAQQQTSGRLEERVYKCSTAGIKLEGTLIERMFYGPPGFGETPAKDARDRVTVLRLMHPITVEPIKGADTNSSTCLNTIKHVRQVQLFPNSAQTSAARKLSGRSVVAAGSLDEATAPRQYTKVTMDVTTITPR